MSRRPDRQADRFDSPRAKLITVAEAAEKLGVHRTRVNVLIKEGRLAAARYGRAYLIDEKDLPLVKDRRPGRPRTNSGVETKHQKSPRNPKR
ncbi:MAG: helix-turn-helix domain-containing protein [Blastocatellia bacterium]